MNHSEIPEDPNEYPVSPVENPADTNPLEPEPSNQPEPEPSEKPEKL